MATDWRTTTLGEVTAWMSGGTPDKANRDYWGGEIPWVSAVSMKTIRLNRAESNITESGLRAGSRLAEKGSVLLLVRGSELHKRIPVGMTERAMAFNQDVKSLRAREGLLPEFLLYWLLASEPTLMANVENTGIGAGRLDTDVLKRLPMRLPDPHEQRAIADILGALDDKIELNRRMNETLEAIARALFKSRFIESSQDGMPREWGRASFAETVAVLGGGTPKTSTPEYWGGDIPWFSVVDAPFDSDVFVIDTEKKITSAGVENSAAQILPEGTTIISARGTVGRVALTGRPMAINQSCYGLRGKVGKRGFYTYFATRALVNELRQRVHGSVFDTITRDTLAGVEVSVPPDAQIEEFERTVAPFLGRIRGNLLESRTLAALRDALLPKLLSGEIRVKNTEEVTSRDS